MSKILKSVKNINGVDVNISTKFSRAGDVELAVDAGCTGLRGDVPREQSSRAFVLLDNLKGDFFFAPVKDDDGHVVGVGICCCGDREIMSLIDTLSFATGELLEPCMTAEQKEYALKHGWHIRDENQPDYSSRRDR